MLFFKSKSKAERLIAKLEKTMKPSGGPMERMARYSQAMEEVKEWGAQHPEEFIALLTKEDAGHIGTYIAGSGARGVELLRGLILGPDLDKAVMAVHALWAFEEEAASEVDLLRELLGHADERMRTKAAQCLARIGPAAVSAGPELARLAQAGGEESSGCAFYALEKTGYDPAIATQICYDAIASGSPGRYMAMGTLDEIGADPTPVLDGILAYIEETAPRDARLLSKAAKLLRKCKLSDANARGRVVQVLERLAALRMETDFVRLLWELDPGNEAVIRRIDAGLRSEGWEKEVACDVICGAKEGGAMFVPLLIERLKASQEHWDFCWAAVDALGEMGPAAIAAKGTLEKLTMHPSELVQERAKEALRKIVSRSGDNAALAGGVNV
jgi:HEAT repeat protein